FSVPSWACRSRSENAVLLPESKRHFRELYILYIHMIQPYLNGTFGESTYYLLLDRRAKQVVSRYTNGKDIFFNAFNAYNLAIVYFFSFVEEICAIDDLKVLLFLLEFLGLPYRKQITSRNGISLCRSDLCASLAVTTILVQPIVDTGGGGIREQLCITFTRAIDRHIGSLVRLILFLRISFPLGDSIFSLQILLHLTNEIQHVFAFFPSAEARGHNSNISTALFSTGGWFTRRTLLNTALGWSENRTIYNSLLSASWVGSLEEDCQVGSAQYLIWASFFFAIAMGIHTFD
ncbi:hypothetical protein ACJX0J_000706, partial (mitochondrion) [Zea mays]